MVVLCAQKEFVLFTKNRGSVGTLSPNFIAASWKLFHSAIIFVGAQGVCQRISFNAMTSSVCSQAENMSPRHARTLSPSTKPNPFLSCHENLNQCICAPQAEFRAIF